MVVLTLFDQTQIAPIFDEKQGYSMAIFALLSPFSQSNIPSHFTSNQYFPRGSPHGTTLYYGLC